MLGGLWDILVVTMVEIIKTEPKKTMTFFIACDRAVDDGLPASGEDEKGNPFVLFLC